LVHYTRTTLLGEHAGISRNNKELIAGGTHYILAFAAGAVVARQLPVEFHAN
jgi:hypothetical protein